MKRNLLLFALSLSALTAFGQTSAESTKPIINENQLEFAPHWYIQAQAGAAQTVGETGFKNLLSPAAALSAGYQFSPLWGMRAGASGWQAKGTWAALPDAYKFNYLQANVDATLDLSNLLCHYNSKRFFNAYMFVGVGLNGAFNNDEAIALDNAGYHAEYLWKEKKVFIAGRGGLGVNMRLSNCVYFNIEANANILSDKFNSKKADNADWQFNALAGLTVKFGGNKKTRIRPEATPALVEIAKEPVQETVAAPIVEPKAEAKEEQKPWSENIFFKMNSSVISSSEKTKIANLASFLNKNMDVKITICGYADAATGTATINMRLSKERAQSVAKALKNQGIAADRITVDFKGDKVQPFSDNEQNRVAICITDKIN